MRTLLSIFSVLALSCALSCSGGDSEDTETADASANIDSDLLPQPDAMPSGVADGTACTATAEDPTGGCGADYVCVGFMAGGATTCRQECPTVQQLCTGYEGPGSSFCGITIQDQAGMDIGNACVVICGDANGTFPGCTAETCDGTCPGIWSCMDDANNPGLKVCM